MKTYKSQRSEKSQEPVKFQIEGEVFEVPRPLPGFVLLDFAAIDDETEGRESVKAFATFFKEVLGPEEYKRFRKVCSKYNVPLQWEGTEEEDGLSLLSIVQYVIAEASGHPLEQPSDSLEQPSLNGTPSDIVA